jgi:hypothetical protein
VEASIEWVSRYPVEYYLPLPMNPIIANASSHQANTLCRYLVEERVLYPGQAIVALYDQARTGMPLDEILVLHGWIDRSLFHRTLLKSLRTQLHHVIKDRKLGQD